MQVQSYQDLEIWQRAMQLAKSVYELTRQFPKEERFGLTAQIRRAAVSIPANIAEGWGRRYRMEFIQFLRIANGSRTELETHLILATQVGLAGESLTGPLIEHAMILGKQIVALERSLSRRNAT